MTDKSVRRKGNKEKERNRKTEEAIRKVKRERGGK
jgi:hypothetical protein